MHYRIAAVALLSAVLVGGCTDIREKYPTWPAWGWWDNPAPSATPVDETTPSADAEPAGLSPADRKSSPADTAAEPDEPLTEEELIRRDKVRQQIWQTVERLRDTDDMDPDRRDALLGATKANLPGWYAELSQPAPNTDDPDWVTLVVWDFMPDYEFFRMRRFWSQTAKRRNLDFPNQGSRRSIAMWVLEFTRSQTMVPSADSAPPSND